jgi:hypothetical protein
MTPSPALDAIRHFQQLVWRTAPNANGGPTDDAKIAVALDKLASAYHLTSEKSPGNTDWLAPFEDRAALKKQAVRNFPDYGAYVCVSPLGSATQVPLIGDALDDIVSISCELKEVALRAERFGVADAEWFFKLLYFSWGNRMRQLSLYVHARQYG